MYYTINITTANRGSDLTTANRGSDPDYTLGGKASWLMRDEDLARIQPDSIVLLHANDIRQDSQRRESLKTLNDEGKLNLTFFLFTNGPVRVKGIEGFGQITYPWSEIERSFPTLPPPTIKNDFLIALHILSLGYLAAQGALKLPQPVAINDEQKQNVLKLSWWTPALGVDLNGFVVSEELRAAGKSELKSWDTFIGKINEKREEDGPIDFVKEVQELDSDICAILQSNQ